MSNDDQPIDLETFPGDDGLLFACKLDEAGGGGLEGWARVEAWKAGDGPIWLHLDRTSDRAKTWLREESGLTTITVEALLSDAFAVNATHLTRNRD